MVINLIVDVETKHILYLGDGQKLALEADKLKINNILQVVNKHAKKLEEIEQANNW